MEPIRTDIPARLDRLPWSRFHWLVVFALGASWAIDGLEVTLTGAVSGILQHPDTLHLDSEEIGGLGSFYLAGAVVGALICGHLTDRHGRAKLFFATLAVYLIGTLATAFAWNFPSMALCRIVTGFGIGGEYAAINSAIDELIPARVRGQVNLGINGSYWIGTALGSVATLWLLDPQFFPIDLGWRAGFFIGALLGFVVLLARRYVPESPRWLTIHGQHDKAMRIVASIESRVVKGSEGTRVPPDDFLVIHPRTHIGFAVIVRTLVRDYPRRAVLGLVLIASQAFLYNAIFFTYALVLTRFYAVPAAETGLYLLPFALGNFAGPLLLGRWFDRFGRRAMIAGTYVISAVLLWGTGLLFARGVLSAQEQTFLWCVIFFFASAAASSAYLTISEIFPLELRALAIALFYATGTAIGGVAAPWLFGILIGSGSRAAVSNGYALGAVLMLIAAAVEAWLGVDAERKSLERIAPPLSTRVG
ncbi:MAG: MFS transporter [Betaproteobacteria bacterium]|nr:MAG: MFS transporter [Betaproteobacteria bacterium]TMH66564.1 MAG: MFS transporter [Betaproteobacteria bacterium]